MFQQQLMTGKQLSRKVYDFMEFKRNKPFFRNPMKIAVGNPLNDSYYMVKNVFYKEKQILALKKEQDSYTIVLVEAKIENGQLTTLSMLSPEFLGEVCILLDDII
jgi:hypothetical protein